MMPTSSLFLLQPLSLSNPVATYAHSIFTFWVIFYFYLGSFLEERHLLQTFGDAYARYQGVTPRFIPWGRSGMSN